MKFVYKLEPIKKVKEILEKKAQEELAQLDKEILFQTDVHNAMCSKRKSIINEDRHNISSTELKYVKEYLSDMNTEISVQLSRIKELSRKRDKKAEDLIQLSKEKKIQEKLKEIHSGFYKENEKKLDLDFLNELAVQGYARKTKL